ncbi:hypothetical protein BLOT_009785 [Blomia tropicalis]|nr:hypothetical protein BLOT_009785 [Blomia tropicalis]
MDRYSLVNDQAHIRNLIHRMPILSKRDRNKYQPYDYDPFYKSNFPLNLERIYNYSIELIDNIEMDENRLIKSFVVNWNPSWVQQKDTAQMKELRKSYWTKVKTDTAQLDVCPIGDVNLYNVRRVHRHEFVYDNQKDRVIAVYLLEWMPEKIDIEKFNEPDYWVFADIIKQYMREQYYEEYTIGSKTCF